MAEAAGPLAASRVAFVRRGLSRDFARVAVAAVALPFLALVVLTLLGALPLAESVATAGLLLGGLAALLLGAVAALLQIELFARPARLYREGDALIIAGRTRRSVPLREITAGFVIPSQHETRVELVRAGGDVIAARVADIPAAEAILRAARVDVANQRCRMQLADTSSRLFVAAAVTFGTMYFSWPFLDFLSSPTRGFLPTPGFGALGTWFFFSALASAIGVRATSLPEVTIGTDGIAFRRGFRETFVPFEELAEVCPAGLGLLIRYRDGREQKIASIAGIGPDRFRALSLRIQEAIAARAAERAPQLELLDRGDRSVGAWRASLTELARRGNTYRAVGLSPDDLEAVLASPDATPERRLAAAVALRAAEHPAARERIRVAAGQCASEKLRVALEQVGDGSGDDEALAEALGLEAETRAGRRAG